MTLKAQVTKENIDKLEYIKIKNFYASEVTINVVKRQAAEWEGIFICISYTAKRLISIVNNEFLQLNNNNDNNKNIQITFKNGQGFE